MMLFGGDYNPEQWIDDKNVLDEDIRRFHEMGINTVSVNIFSWSFLEPEEGRYDFSFLSSLLDRLYEEGISVNLATPSGARPKWLSDKYPEVLRVREDRTKMIFGERHNHCYTSPVYREKVRLIDEALSNEFGHHKAVIAWHISNEYGGECHCPLCQEAFHRWLEGRYDSISDLNRKWNNAFWSHIYDSFDAIDSPSSIGESKNPALSLEWKRFVTHQTVDFMNEEIKAVRKYSDLPVTTNMMYDYLGLDYQAFSDSLDFISWDNYPAWGTGFDGDDVLVAADNAMEHDYYRAMKDKPFILMESCPEATNWQPLSHLKRHGVMEAASLEAVAHGSDGVLFFQMRHGRGGYEKFHGALLDSSGCETRTIREARTLGNKLTALKDVIGTVNKPVAGIIRDTESRWAMEGSAGPRNKGLHYRDNLRCVYLGLRSSGLEADVIGPEHNFSAYRILVVPMLYMFREGLAERLESFTADGGILVVTHWSGVVDEYDSIYPGKTPYGLSEVLGLRRAEIDALQDGVENVTIPVAGNGLGLRKNYTCSVLSEIPEVYSAEPILLYGNDFYKGLPVVTEHDYKKGMSYYIASMMEEDFYHDFFLSLIEKNGIEPIAKALPRGMFASERIGNGKRYIFLQNFSGNDVLLSSSLLNGKRIIGDGDILKPYDTFVFER